MRWKSHVSYASKLPLTPKHCVHNSEIHTVTQDADTKMNDKARLNPRYDEIWSFAARKSGQYYTTSGRVLNSFIFGVAPAERHAKSAFASSGEDVCGMRLKNPHEAVRWVNRSIERSTCCVTLRNLRHRAFAVALQICCQVFR